MKTKAMFTLFVSSLCISSVSAYASVEHVKIFPSISPTTRAALIAMAPSLSTEEQNFTILLNRFRWNLGLQEVKIHPAIQSASRAHSQWMSLYQILEHYGPYTNTTFADRIINAGFKNYTYLAENIACGYADASRTFKQWANSPSHLKNMVNSHFKYIGIAREGSEAQDCPFYWTNDFGTDTDPRLESEPVLNPQFIRDAIEQVVPGESL